MKEIKAYCVIAKPNTTAKHFDRFIGNIKIDLMGTNENPYFSIHPKTNRGLEQAEDNCNSYEEVAECKILVLQSKPHKCNCQFCKKNLNL